MTQIKIERRRRSADGRDQLLARDLEPRGELGGDDLGLMEVEEAAQHIREMVDPDANIIVGSAFNDNLNEEEKRYLREG